jgi:transcriptional regulator with XRE-family HTH domain
MEIQERFRSRRKEMGWTQKEVAGLSGVPYASVRRFESSGEISLSSLKKLLTALDMGDQLDALFARRVPVPQQFYPFLWDVNPDSLDAHRDSRYIIARLLTKGNAYAMAWVDNEYSPNEIRDCAAHVRDLSPQTAEYLSKRYQIPHSHMPYFTRNAGDWRCVGGKNNDS